MMAQPIRILVDGNQHHGSSAPAVGDLIDQIRDFMHVLQAAEIACHGKTELRWLVTNASMQSPFSMELTPDSAIDGTNIDHSASSTIAMASSAVNQVIATGRLPDFFPDMDLSKIDHMAGRIINGLATFEVDFSQYGKTKKIFVNESKAAAYIEKKKRARDSFCVPRWKRGSMEGYTLGVGTNERGFPILRLKSKLKGYTVKCIDSEGGLDKIGDVKVKDLLAGLRVRVFGQMHYKNLSDIDQIKVERMHVYPHDSQLPDLLNLKRANLTDGLGAVAFVRSLRDAE